MGPSGSQRSTAHSQPGETLPRKHSQGLWPVPVQVSSRAWNVTASLRSRARWKLCPPSTSKKARLLLLYLVKRAQSTSERRNWRQGTTQPLAAKRSRQSNKPTKGDRGPQQGTHKEGTRGAEAGWNDGSGRRPWGLVCSRSTWQPSGWLQGTRCQGVIWGWHPGRMQRKKRAEALEVGNKYTVTIPASAPETLANSDIRTGTRVWRL